jgi:hypothetical protein
MYPLKQSELNYQGILPPIEPGTRSWSSHNLLVRQPISHNVSSMNNCREEIDLTPINHSLYAPLEQEGR